MRIGLFGGSFNPPHIAHLIGAEIAYEVLDLDKLLLVPAAIPPHKQDHDLPDPQVRLEMTKAAVADNPRFDVCGIELERSGPSYTIDTVLELRRLYPEAQFVLIIGLDNLEILHSWYRSAELVELVEVAVMVRPGYSTADVSEAMLERVSFVELPLLEISGTKIRQRLHEGKSIQYWVPEAVRAYIKVNHVYE